MACPRTKPQGDQPYARGADRRPVGHVRVARPTARVDVDIARSTDDRRRTVGRLGVLALSAGALLLFGYAAPTCSSTSQPAVNIGGVMTLAGCPGTHQTRPVVEPIVGNLLSLADEPLVPAAGIEPAAP